MRTRRTRIAALVVLAIGATQLRSIPTSLAGGMPASSETIAEALAAGRVDAAVVGQLTATGSTTALVYVDDVTPADLVVLPSGADASRAPAVTGATAAGEQPASGRRAAPAAGSDPQQNAERRAVLDDRKSASRESVGARVRVTRSYPDLPVTKVTITSQAALADLLSSPATRLIGEDLQLQRSIVNSLNLIGQPAALVGTTGGAGTYVGVLDSGADYTISALGSCSAPDTPSTTCRVAELPPDFATSDGRLDDSGRHGTEVSAVVAATAPGTKLIVGDVFNGTSATTSDILSGIQYMIGRRQAGKNIVALNLSLGLSGTYSCTIDRFGLASLEAAGIQPVVASGNSAYTSGVGFRDGLSDPACSSPVVLSVGGVYNQTIAGTVTWGSGCAEQPIADKVMCISQSGPTLSLLAPGALLTIAGSTNIGGTSFAAPFVSGAVAYAAALSPGLSLAAIRAQLISTGKPILDTRFNRTTPRLDLTALKTRLTPAANDNWQQAQPITLSQYNSSPPSYSASVTGDNYSAGGQTGEPGAVTPDGPADYTSIPAYTVWYGFTAPVTADVTASATVGGSSWQPGLFENVAGAPSGVALLHYGPGGTARVLRGHSYLLMVPGIAQVRGAITASINVVSVEPPNDARSTPTVVGPGSTSVPFDNSEATAEPGDPSTQSSGRTLWYRIPAGSGRVTVSGSSGVVLRAFRAGSSIGRDQGGSAPSVGPFESETGPIELLVDTAIAAPSAGTLTFTHAAGGAPGNDNRSAAMSIGWGSVVADNAYATSESSEVHGGAAATRSVWFRWSPGLAAGGIALDGTNFMPRLTVINENDSSTVCDVTATVSSLAQCIVNGSASYLIAVDGANGEYGTIKMTTLLLDAARATAPATLDSGNSARSAAPPTPSSSSSGRPNAPAADIAG